MKEYTFHPACLAFPEMDEAALKDLADDIAKNGMVMPILTRKGMVIDGRSRLAACRLANEEPHFKEMDLEDDAAVWSLVYSLNLHHRHLTKAEKDAALKAFLLAAPQLSNHQISKATNRDRKTVAKVRAEAEALGEIPQCPAVKTTDGRQYPARRPASTPKSEPKDAPPKPETPAPETTGPEDAPEETKAEVPPASAAEETKCSPTYTPDEAQAIMVEAAAQDLERATERILACVKNHGLSRCRYEVWKAAEAEYLRKTKGVKPCTS